MKKKYRVLKKMPWMKKGFEFETDEDNDYRFKTVDDEKIVYFKKELADLVKKGWIEPVNERIELVTQADDLPAFNFEREDGGEITIKQIKLMEQAINGELFTKEDKTCTKCGKEYPATKKYFYRCPYSKDGFKLRCKDCMKEYLANFYIKI